MPRLFQFINVVIQKTPVTSELLRFSKPKTGNFSKPKPIHFGVPEGSVLGPFFLYLNVLTNSSRQLDLMMFADDTVLIQNQSTDQSDF